MKRKLALVPLFGLLAMLCFAGCKQLRHLTIGWKTDTSTNTVEIPFPAETNQNANPVQ